ncbi:MAG TPA: VWA domain-containing protein [Spirochaetota bacterium]|nr:VWA domain-containing protein [Spirochaetota bacterium]
MKLVSLLRSSVLRMIIVVLMVMPFFLFNCSGEGDSGVSAGGKDMILVLDTSLSMVGKGGGGKNIFPKVKDSLGKFISKLDEGDTLTVMTFDTRVTTYPTVKITGDNDKNIVKQYVSLVEAKGQWTYTMKMMKTVFEKAQELEQRQAGRQQVIVVLTDGLDDPPPALRGETFNLKKVSSAYTGKEWFIYLVNFGELKKNKRIAQVASDLKKITPNTKVISGDKGPRQAIETDLQRDVERSVGERQQAQRSFFASPWFIAILVIVVLLVVLFFFNRYSKIKVTGSLEYYNHALLDPYVENYNMTNQHLREVLIGTTGCNLNIRDLEVNGPVKIRAERQKGKIVVELYTPEGVVPEFVNRDAGNLLEDGDKFILANYTFKFMAE